MDGDEINVWFVVFHVFFMIVWMVSASVWARAFLKEYKMWRSRGNKGVWIGIDCTLSLVVILTSAFCAFIHAVCVFGEIS